MHFGIQWRLEPLLECFRPESQLSDSSVLPWPEKAIPRKTTPHHGKAQHLMQLTNEGMVYRNCYASRVDSLWDPCEVSPGYVLPHSCYDTPWYTPVISTSRVLCCCFPISATHLVPSSPTDCKIRSHSLMACYLLHPSHPDTNRGKPS